MLGRNKRMFCGSTCLGSTIDSLCTNMSERVYVCVCVYALLSTASQVRELPSFSHVIKRKDSNSAESFAD